MARKPPRQYVRDIADELAPKFRKIFLEAVSETATRAQISKIAQLLEQGRLVEAAQAVGITQAAFEELEPALKEALKRGGGATALLVPPKVSPEGVRTTFLFSVRNPRAEQWIAQHSGTLIREISNEQLTVIRNHLNRGLVAGDNPRTVARTLVGKINPATGLREGGVIGLTDRQAAATDRYYRQLISGDPDEMRAALNRGLRDRRFDSTVRQAIANGTPIPKDKAEAMLRSYRNRYLKFRADTIARTEMIDAMHQAQGEAWRQAVEQGHVQQQAITRFWHTAGDERVRPAHQEIPGMNRDGVGLDQPFETPDGPYMHPPAGPLCRCWVEVKVDFLRGIQ